MEVKPQTEILTSWGEITKVHGHAVEDSISRFKKWFDMLIRTKHIRS